jgi:hypothetical protein
LSIDVSVVWCRALVFLGPWYPGRQCHADIATFARQRRSGVLENLEHEVVGGQNIGHERLDAAEPCISQCRGEQARPDAMVVQARGDEERDFLHQRSHLGHLDDPDDVALGNSHEATGTSWAEKLANVLAHHSIAQSEESVVNGVVPCREEHLAD